LAQAILAQSQAASKDRNDQLDIDLCGQYDQAQHPGETCKGSIE